MSPRTAFLSKLIGLYCILGPGSMLIHRQDTVQTINALVASRADLFVVGIFTLVAGLALVLGHNIWSGGAGTVVVTLVGWASLIKGIFLVSLPQSTIADMFAAAHYDQFGQFYVGVSVIIGVYLTYAGFAANQASISRTSGMTREP